MTRAKTINTASDPIASDAAADMTWPMPTIVASVFMKAPAFGIGVPKTIGDSRRGSSVSRSVPSNRVAMPSLI
jgi:hypothetical protein